MVNYANGKIYCIRSHQTNDIYIGSTCQTLSKRMTNHRNDYKRYTEGKTKRYTSSFDILKYGDAYIELIELYPCNQKCELLKQEGGVIRDRKCVNKRIAGRTKKQYYLDNKDEIKQYHNQYYQDNKDELKQSKKQYQEDNKDKIKEYRKQKVTCECGAIITKRCKTRHIKSKKHQDFIQNNNVN